MGTSCVPSLPQKPASDANVSPQVGQILSGSRRFFLGGAGCPGGGGDDGCGGSRFDGASAAPSFGQNALPSASTSPQRGHSSARASRGSKNATFDGGAGASVLRSACARRPRRARASAAIASTAATPPTIARKVMRRWRALSWPIACGLPSPVSMSATRAVGSSPRASSPLAASSSAYFSGA